MTNPSKQKGTAAETALLRWLQSAGRPARRNPPAGVKDVGDITIDNAWSAAPDTVVEVKNHRNLATAINQGLAELDVEMVNANSTSGVLVVKRHGKGDPGEWLAIRKVRNDPEIGAV